MSTIVKFNNKVLRLNNKTVGYTKVPYYVTTNGVNGTVIATPNTGYNGDTITLSNIPDYGYAFDTYSLTGATLKNTNQFDIDYSNVNVSSTFIEEDPFTTITINNLKWMKYNLAYDDGGEGIYKQDNVIVNGVNIGTQYYYNRNATVRMNELFEGWHVATLSEWNAISQMSPWGSNKLKATYGWNYDENNKGTDTLGLQILPAGCYYNGFMGRGTDAFFTIATTSVSHHMLEQFTYNSNSWSWIQGVDYAGSIRLIKDT